MVFVPIKTSMRRVLGTQYLHEMAIQCSDPDSIPEVIANVESLMRHRHRLPAYKENDFMIRNNAAMQEAHLRHGALHDRPGSARRKPRTAHGEDMMEIPFHHRGYETRELMNSGVEK